MHVTSEIVNCRLTAERIVTGPSGRIAGGALIAATEIDTGSLGTHSGTLTEVSVTSPLPVAVIRARLATHPGVVVHLGEARRHIEEELPSASFWEVAGGVVTLRSTADEHEAQQAREVPEAHAVPEVSQIPEAPEASDLPEVAAAPDAPATPDTPASAAA
ncbi:MAG: hypothetical protein EXR65_04405 [Dehalococcoidia bacterium]|nr:hypothetical protein [Dehalococcoidia bacterium]